MVRPDVVAGLITDVGGEWTTRHRRSGAHPVL
jgi:hypothetical protein